MPRCDHFRNNTHTHTPRAHPRGSPSTSTAEQGTTAPPSPWRVQVRCSTETGLKVSEEILPLLNVRSNNIAEYEGVRAGLRLLRRGDPPPEGNVTVRGDSQGGAATPKRGSGFAAINPSAPSSSARARLAADLGPRITLTYEHVKRELNVDADALSNAAMDEAERQGETSQEQLRQDFAAFQKSILGKAHSLRQLCEVVRKTSKQPWHCGHTASSTVLTAIGGTVAGGLSRRAQLSPATESVMRSLQAHTAGPGLNQRDTAFHSRGMAWAATFAPQPHYPEGWQQAAQQWTASSRQANARTGRSWERRGAAPRTAPPGARRNAKMLTCALHWKPRCVDCRRRRLSEEDCCRDHHGKNDGLQVTMEFCKTHRMGPVRGLPQQCEITHTLLRHAPRWLCLTPSSEWH